jgi:hypothetical protein
MSKYVPHNIKVKIGTVLEDDILQKLKEHAIKEKRPINEIIQEALVRYLSTSSMEEKKLAVTHFCSKPFHLSMNEVLL